MWLLFTTVRSPVIFCFQWLVLATRLQAQTTPPKPQLVHIHEAPIIPTMVDQYERASKKMVSQCRKNGIQDNDHRYYTFKPIEHMADLNKDPLAPLQEKLGKEAFATLFARFCHGQ